MKAVVAAFNQEKALVGAFSVITNVRMEIFEALVQDEVRAEHERAGRGQAEAGQSARGGPRADDDHQEADGEEDQ